MEPGLKHLGRARTPLWHVPIAHWRRMAHELLASLILMHPQRHGIGIPTGSLVAKQLFGGGTTVSASRTAHKGHLLVSAQRNLLAFKVGAPLRHQAEE